MSFHYNYDNVHTVRAKRSSHHHGGGAVLSRQQQQQQQQESSASVSTVGFSKQGYSTMNAISQNALSAAWGGSRKRAITEDEYFDDDEEEASSTNNLAYIPAPGSPSNNRIASPNSASDEDDDADPLDAFMAGIEMQVKHEANNAASGDAKKAKVVRNDLEDADDEESYYRYMEENPMAGVLPVDEDDPVEYDEDGNPIAPERRKIIDPLPPIDHTQIVYPPFRKDFYKEHEEIHALSASKADALRRSMDLCVTGQCLPRPVCSFGHFGFDDNLLKAIVRAEYAQPTPIQSQAVPAALAGRDVLGVAQTGSGKTAAFLWPLLVHVAAARPPVVEGDGPIALVLAPTRELALQIYNEARRFARVYDLRVVCAYGGGSKWEQSNALRAGAEIVVATPGRIIDHVKGGATNLQRVTFLVLDEADRMFELGFEPQVRSVVNHVRPDRQTLLFSATFKRKIERLAKDALCDPVKISQGVVGQANEDVTQHALILADGASKRRWLYTRLVEFTSAGSVLIFVTKKLDAEQVAGDLRVQQFDCLLLHGDMEQAERNKVITAFKRQECVILVATDVAARGLDIPHVRTVVNFDLARDIDTHTHRIGRTGRAGTQGTAYTLLTDKDKEFAGHIVRNLEAAHQEVPQEVLDLALQASWFKKARYKRADQPASVGGLGLGFSEKVAAHDYNTPQQSQHHQQQSPRRKVPAAAVAAACGPATDRLSAMKAAFKAQYSTQFTAQQTESSSSPQLATSGHTTSSSSSSSSSPRKKSRWQ